MVTRNQSQLDAAQRNPIVGVAVAHDAEDGTVDVQLNGMVTYPTGPIWVAPGHVGLGNGIGDIITAPNTGGLPYTPDPQVPMTSDRVYVGDQNLQAGSLVSINQLAPQMGEEDLRTANLVAELIKHVDPQDEGLLQLELDDTARLYNDQAVVNAVNAELSFEESVGRVEKIKLTHKFTEREGVWKGRPILKIALRTVTIMDLGDEK